MKKTFKHIRTLAALLIASAAFTACSNEDSAIIGEQPAQQQAPQVFTLTLQAGKTDGAGTRALALDGTKLVAKWAAGDEVTVVRGSTPLGTLTASNVSADGNTCTFSGTLGTAPSANDALTLTYHPVASLSAYTSQTGTLASAANYDVATATVTVASVSGGEITIKETSATFTTQTAVLKLTLKDVADNALKATSLKISAGGADIFTFTPTDATYTANTNGILYFALPSAATVAAAKGITTEELATLPITFTATVGSDTYIAMKTGYQLAGGKYYASELKMTKPTDLSSISGTEYTVKNGEVLTGTLASNMKISIADGAIVLLKDADINVGVKLKGTNAGITCDGDATIILEGTNKVKGYTDTFAGIYVPQNKTLTIMGSGSLDATGGDMAAGIGGGDGGCGNITITSGTITATGGDMAAGIGSGTQGSCGNITISGGTVTATGGDFSAGIGGGYQNKTCGTITITSGVTSVTATKGLAAPNSIGASLDGTAISVTIDPTANVTEN